MKARLIVGILIVGLIVAAVTITWNRGGGSDGATVTQVAHREPSPTEPPPPKPPLLVHEEPPRATSNGHLQADASSDAQPATIAATESAESNSTALKTDDVASKPDDVTQAPASDGATPKGNVVPVPASMPATRPVVSIASSAFEPECQQIREAIKADTTTPRGDLLSMYARTSEGSGEFRVAAAACALFLDEFGNDHPLGGRFMGTGSKPVANFREGNVGLSVWQREGNKGPFYEFTISRSYKKKDDTYGYSTSFSESNLKALWELLGQAAEWMEKNPPAGSCV